jgi:hypothetical protein
MRILFILLLGVTSTIGAQVSTVQTHKDVVIQTEPSRGFTNYSGWGVFPTEGKTYSKVTATLTFECAPGLRCGEWDYLNYIYLGKRRGNKNDSLGWEIMRFITPYGNSYGAINGWKHGWKFDLTDLGQLLHDSIEIIYRHTGYEAKADRGWKINLTFDVVEGKPARDILSITNLVQKGMDYTSNITFANAYAGDTLEIDSNSDISTIKILQTGHGAVQPENCGEFCNKKRYTTINGKVVNTQNVWRDDCGENSLFPQSGTWLYDRAGWCPGDGVREDNIDLKLRHDTIQVVDFDMENYTANGGGSNYRFTAYHVQKGKLNYEEDANILDIISPSDWFEHLRVNPSCGMALVKVRNDGRLPLTTIDFNYGFNGAKDMKHWVWDELAPGETKIYQLPLKSIPSTSSSFSVEIAKVNDKAKDQNASNDEMSTPLSNSLPDLRPEKMIVFFKTNNAPTENSYRFKDGYGHVIYEKKGFTQAQTIFRDTFTFYNGCWEFEFDDKGPANPSFPLNEDGLGWWANTTDGNGLIQLRDGNTGFLLKNFPIDFGTQFNYFFTTGFALNTPNQEIINSKIYPNPANKEFFIDYQAQFNTLSIYNLAGSKVHSQVLNPQGGQIMVSTATLAPGVYNVTLQGTSQSQQYKIVIIH